jgi:hypothetical protein
MTGMACLLPYQVWVKSLCLFLVSLLQRNIRSCSWSFKPLKYRCYENSYNRHLLCFLLQLFSHESLQAQSLNSDAALDARVKKFLDDNRGSWYDMNIPYADGQKMYDIIVSNGYKSALEIGTSTGLSGIWIAWALSKTGGKLITIDIDRTRHEKAVENFKKAGLIDYIDARLADAHELGSTVKRSIRFCIQRCR